MALALLRHCCWPRKPEFGGGAFRTRLNPLPLF